MSSKLQEWKKRVKDKNGYINDKEEECASCGRKYYLTIDHIIPEHILISLNLMTDVEDWEENFEIICGACNRLKGGQLDLKHPKTFQLLEEAIRRSKEQIK